VRTTVTLSDALFAKAKRQAAQDNVTLSELVEAALRDRLLRPRSPEPPPPFRLVTFGEGGLQPGVSFEGLKDLADQEQAERLAGRAWDRAADGSDDPARR
jgi:hypothetical protein